MEALRTPDERFADLADYPFAPNYHEVADGGLRLHHLDEGPRDAPVVVMMHGEPSWSYLYRHMLPPVVAAGCRVLAPDLIGFGRSDKPTRQEDYTYERHVAWMLDWLDALAVRDAVLFCQDWGGLIGLRLVAARADRFAGVVASNTALPIGQGLTPAFEQWLHFSQTVPELPVARIIQGAVARTLTDAELAAYDAPFPDERFKAGARRFPALVPVTAEHASVAENLGAWAALERFEQPFVTAFGDSDPVTAGADALFQAKVPGARGQPHRVIAGGRHFIQEDAAAELAEVIVDTVRRTRPAA